jgi:hypothetical protein
MYWLASLLMCGETGFNISFPPESLPEALDDLISAVEDIFVKIDNDPQIPTTDYSSILESLQQCIFWGGVRLSPLGTLANIWPIVPAPDDRR